MQTSSPQPAAPTLEVATPTPQINQDDLDLLSHIVESEAGNQSWEVKILVASVVVNRTHDKNYPDTIYGVIHQHGQYQYLSRALRNHPSDGSIKAARYVLENGIQCPQTVVYQSEERQGSGIYKHIEGTYFCYK